MQVRKNIALVAHDNRKEDMMEYVGWNAEILARHNLICTGTTGRLVKETLENTLKRPLDEKITLLKSGPLGGDQQLGAAIAEGRVDMVFFLWDPMSPHPHDVDVKALLRIAIVYNVPIACNRATADFMITSPLMEKEYTPSIKDYSAYIQREV